MTQTDKQKTGLMPQTELFEDKVVFSISEKTYKLDIIKMTAFIFIDRCYVHLDRTDDSFVVTLTGKEPLSAKELEALQGEFLNELLNQAVRKQIGKENSKIREMIVAKALLSATRANSAIPAGARPEPEQVRPWDDVSQEEQDELDKLLNEIESEIENDPDGIGTSWDDKFKSEEKPEDKKPEDKKK